MRSLPGIQTNYGVRAMAKKQIAPIVLSLIISILLIIFSIILFNHWKGKPVYGVDSIIERVVEDEGPDFKSIIRLAEKTVVQIEAHNKYDTLTGSGFLFNEKGDIMTNAHVVQDAEYIYVRTANAHIYPAALVGISDETDIAVLRVLQLAGESHLPLEKENFAETGDEVIALGSPHGFQNTVTLGIISGTERNFSLEGFKYENIYQISAPITHGNSGGPLIDRDTGFIIGMNSVGSSDGTIGFSIPIKEVIDEVERWSASVHNEDLNFPITEDILLFDPEELEQDANYLVDYFFEGIQMRDYINSYTLFGNVLQDKISYSNFREKFIHTLEIKYDIESIETTEEQIAKAITRVSLEKILPDEDETEQIDLKYTFTISYENDQIKILNLSEEEL